MSFYLHSDVLPVGLPVDDVVLELTRPLDHLKRARVGAADLLPRARVTRAFSIDPTLAARSLLFPFPDLEPHAASSASD